MNIEILFQLNTMTEQEKKSLYESIMQDVAKVVKQRIEEMDYSSEQLDEATTMMKLKQKNNANPNQRDIDRFEFNECYNKMRDETIILSDPNAIIQNENYKKLVGMGRRIVPFIYERITNRVLADTDISIALLPEIYGERPEASSQSEYRKKWAKKIEESGDV